MKSLIDDAPENIRRNYLTRLYGKTLLDARHAQNAEGTSYSVASLAAGYLAAKTYANQCHFDVPRYQPYFGPLLEQLKLSGDERTWRLFSNTYAIEIKLEREAEESWQAQHVEGGWVEGPSYEEVVAKNQAAASADRLEAEIRDRANELMRTREVAARAAAFADARQELGK
jgi:hypothetical protein